ncbi:hypothetical protein FH968_19765 [Buttiauxella sp. B2]|uniref:hypothetical protein n=1 Tax=Buttiauxella sp. B2 TaxID=2587812 RepID=UPI001122090C|nr:hypothetical protein [Buttiauxella sp. B2]TNV16082.1 hypothetical protein FH968_19765 [Buttiauxella sp. B2]
MNINELAEISWFHGGDDIFQEWSFPPPMKKNQNYLIRHSPVFFTANKEYALGAGKRLAVSSLKKDANILNTISNYAASEKLRVMTSKIQLMEKSLNVQHDFWHRGWLSGDVLRYAWTDVDLEHHFHKEIRRNCEEYDMSKEYGTYVFNLNLTRSLIESICKCAFDMGYDGLFGHEVDRHSVEGKTLSQPILAVFRENVISSPVWIGHNSCGELIG